MGYRILPTEYAEYVATLLDRRQDLKEDDLERVSRALPEAREDREVEQMAREDRSRYDLEGRS